MDDLCWHDLLLKVEKPARYTGNEWNAIKKNYDEVDVSFVLAFPDTYEVGMSFLGYKIIYDIINNYNNYAAERVFAPWFDMEEQLRSNQLHLTSLESNRPLKSFDIIAFTLQYEMSYTNILNMLDLAGVPVFSNERTDEHPFVLAGGPCAANPEPLADFIDIFFIGEAEEALIDLADCCNNTRHLTRDQRLKAFAKIESVYVPAVHEGQVIRRRIVKDLDAAAFVDKLIVPLSGAVHDRVMLEIQRGCTRGCRFCQAGMIYRPVRERSVTTLLQQATELIADTGYDEISLTSLASNDYTDINALINGLQAIFKDRHIGISLPSLRADKFSVGLAEQLQQVRKSGLTFAPEAGSQRLRDVINKGVRESDLLEAVNKAFLAGYKQVKLYFMLGLPTETDEDVIGIAELAEKVVMVYRDVHNGKAKGLRVTVSTSLFVPKPHTPFQWCGQLSLDEMRRRRILLSDSIKSDVITYNWHDPGLSFMEAAISRSGREVGKVIWQAWQDGCKFDSWTEGFKYRQWLEAWQKQNMDPVKYANKDYDLDEELPWQHINMGVSKKFLINEYKKAMAGIQTEDCRTDNCSACGVCMDFGVDVSLAKRGAN